MKIRKTSIITVLLALLLMLSLAACGAPGDPPADTDVPDQTDQTDQIDDADAAEIDVPEGAFANDGMILSVPEEYADLLVVDTPEDDVAGILFVVSEKASVEAGKIVHPGEDWGDGWLFSIGRANEEWVHEQLCGDMSGREIFARAENGDYYIFYTPTDVRLMREDDDYLMDEETIQQWTTLNEWAATVPETFLNENKGLTPYAHTNTDLDIYLSCIAYKEDTNYSIDYLTNGALDPRAVDKTPYITRLLDGVTFEMVDEEAPDGEYIVLNLPDDNLRFDFFFGGGGNYVREVYGNGAELLYKATYADGATVANQVMEEWYNALADAQ